VAGETAINALLLSQVSTIDGEPIVNMLWLASIGEIASHAWVWFVAPAGALAALISAFLFSRRVMAHSEGDPDMIEIAQAVREGAMAYLTRQYKVVAVVFVLLALILVAMGMGGIQSLWSALGVPVAGTLSGLCGWFGMKMATHASARTTFAAKQSLDEGLRVAFRAGAVMGLIVVGFALLDVSMWFLAWNTLAPGSMTLVDITTIMLSYGMGASTQALFARVGGGIYTKAADVGADLVGKVEAGIPEDDPRNPATIADNVGDNVGDVAGMGADLYESYYGSILASMALGAAAAFRIGGEDWQTLALRLTVAPMALAGLGILCSLVGVFVVRAKKEATFSQLLRGLHLGVYVASALTAILAALVLVLLFSESPVSGWGVWGAIVAGLVAGLVIAYATEYYTSYEHRPTQSISEQAQTGPATVIIAGVAVGMKSTWVPLISIVLAIIAAFSLAGGATYFLLGLYGVGIAAVGMLSTLGITLATDAYGPIADNAGGNAEMTKQPPFVRERTDMLDSLGNTTAATGKGFAIGSAALTALALLAAYLSVVQTKLSSQLASAVPNPQAVLSEVGRADYGAVHQGRGRFSIVDRSNNEVFGAIMLAGEHVGAQVKEAMTTDDVVPFNGPLSEDVNAYEVRWLFGNDLLRFQLVPTERATIKQLLSFYEINLMNPRVLGGVFLGVMLAFVFCALTMSAVGRAAYRMMNECRRQFGLMKVQFLEDGMSEADIADPNKWPHKVMVGSHRYPDYAQCVAISTAGAQREMIVPALFAIVAPVVVGLLLGVGGVMGLLVGGLTSGFAIAIFMANAGGAWDNAKKWIEKGHFGGKGSDAHKAGVVGDTVGDPFKDTSGPSLNILIKLIAIVSVVFCGLIVKFSLW
jgi:H(+)-translocating pyrophosphatase